MKMVIITNLYPPLVRGGAEKVAAEQAAYWRSAGQEVLVITFVPRANMGFTVEANGVRVVRLWHFNLYFLLANEKHFWGTRLLNLFWNFLNWPLANAVKKILVAEKPAVVLTHNLFGTSWLIPRVIKKLGLRHEHFLHDVQLAIPSGRLLVGEENLWKNVGWPARVYGALQKWCWGSPRAVRSPAQWLLDFYATRGFFSQSEKILQRPKISVPEKFGAAKEKYFLYAGQIETAKGVLMLAANFVELWHAGLTSDYQLIFAGAGAAEQKLKEIIAPCPTIKFLGWQENEKLTVLLQGASYLLVPSLLYENSPTIIAQALRQGCLVAVARVGGAPELVEIYGGEIIEPTATAWLEFLKNALK